MRSFILATGGILPREMLVILNKNAANFSKHPTHPAKPSAGLDRYRVHKPTQHPFNMKFNDKMLLALYSLAVFCRLKLKVFYLRFKLRYVFIYRCQHFCILLLYHLDILQKKWSLYRLFAMQAALKHLHALFNRAKTKQSRIVLIIAKLLWIPLHILCKWQHLTPETNKNSDFVNQPDKHVIIAAQCLLYLIEVSFPI
jgi:hypothetical protein